MLWKEGEERKGGIHVCLERTEGCLIQANKDNINYTNPWPKATYTMYSSEYSGLVMLQLCVVV